MATQEISENDLQVAIDKAVTKALHAHTPQTGNTPQTPLAIPSTENKTHAVYDFMQYCPGPNCGSANPDYKKPTAYCKDCNVPLGQKEDVEQGHISKCWNCGGTEAKGLDEE